MDSPLNLFSSNNSDLVKSLINGLNDLRKQNQFCDITINVDGRAFRAHRAVLVSTSSYFKAMLTSGFKEQGQKEVSIEGKADVFEILLQYLYTGKLAISPRTPNDIICGIIDMANYIQLTSAVESCSESIDEWCTREQTGTNSVKPADKSAKDTFQFYLFAKTTCLSDLVKKLELNLEENFKQMKDDYIMENANADFWESFLSRENLAKVDEEEHVLELVTRWLKYDWQNRCQDAYTLLKKVRLGLVPDTRRKELLDDAICAIPECKALLEKMQLLQSSDDVKLQYPEFFAARSAVTAPVRASILRNYRKDGSVESSTLKFCYFDAKKQKWDEIPCFPNPDRKIGRSGLVEVDGKLYLIGGYGRARKARRVRRATSDSDDSDDDESSDDELSDDDQEGNDVVLREVYGYKPEDCSWFRLRSMEQSRSSFPLVHVGDYVYAVGGTTNDSTNSVEFQSVECCAAEDNGLYFEWIWFPIDSLPELYTGVSAVGFKDRLLVYGIKTTGSSFKHVLQVLRHHGHVNTWQVSLSEDHSVHDSGLLLRHPTLFVHQNVCYRVVFHSPSRNVRQKTSTLSRPVVNVLNMECPSNNRVSITIGEKVNQNHIPDNKSLAFQIKNEVFAVENDSVFNTGIEIGANQTKYVDLTTLEAHARASRKKIGSQIDHSCSSSIVSFTFDKRVLADKEMEGWY